MFKTMQDFFQNLSAPSPLDANENHVISKVAGLLHLTHGESIVAKMRARRPPASRSPASCR